MTDALSSRYAKPKPKNPPFWAGLVPAVLFTGGSILIFLGAIEHQLGKVYVGIQLQVICIGMGAALLILRRFGIFGTVDLVPDSP